MKNFYRKFQLISRFPLWLNYIRWVYKKTIDDCVSLGCKPINKRGSFACLLCGVSGEITANEYFKFVLGINPKAKIWIIDLGKDQVKSVQKLVEDKYSQADIKVMKANALSLSFIKSKSLDWIDIDGLFSFFDEKQLLELFQEWDRILKNDGYITFRELTSHNPVSKNANILRDKVSQIYMSTKLHLHTLDELIRIFEKLNFKHLRGRSPIPLLDRYCIVKN